MFTRFTFNRLWISVLLVIFYTLCVVSVSLAERDDVVPFQQASTPTATQTPTANPAKQFVAKLGGPLIFDFPTPEAVSSPGPISGPEELSALEKSSMATVKLVGCLEVAAPSCTSSKGSGSIIHPNGLILTVLHAVVEDSNDLNSRVLPEINVGVLEDPNEPVQFLYRARVVAIEPDLDLALLWITPSPDKSEIFLPTLPIKSIGNTEIANGRWRILGFPQAQVRLKQREAEYFDNHDGIVEIGVQLIQQGFSGGPLLVQNEERYYEAGVIYFHNADGEVLARSVNQLRHLRWLDTDTSTPRLWAENVQIKPINIDGLIEIQLSANIHAIDLAGKMVKFEALAYDVKLNKSWPIADEPLFFPLKTIYPTRFVDAIPVELNKSLIGLAPVPERLRFVVRIRSEDEPLPLWREEVNYVHHPASLPTVTATDTPTRMPTAAHTPTHTATVITPNTTSTSTATYTPTPTRTATAETLNLPSEVIILLSEWDRIHHAADRTLDTSELSSVLSEEALRKQLRTIDRLKSTNCYWIFNDLAPSRILAWRRISSTELIVDVRKHWDGKLYCNNKLNTGGSFSNPFNVRYNIKEIDGWRIILNTEISDNEVMSN